jgi:hypothetical protein
VKGRKPRKRSPSSARQYEAMSAREQETWDSVAHVISRMRAGASLKKASSEFNISPGTVIELGDSALRKRDGRFVAKKIDRLLRVITILTVEGKREIATRDSEQASLAGSHWAAVQTYLQTGERSAVLRFRGQRIVDESGKRYLLLTDLADLNRYASAGVLSFESMYAGGAH